MSEWKVVIFDVCGTLYRSNTTYDFLMYYFKNRNTLKYYKVLFCASFPIKAFLVIFKILGLKHDLRKFLINLLKGEGQEKVEAQAIYFAQNILANKKLTTIHNFLIIAQKEGKKVYLASASIDPVVKAIAIELNIAQFISSTLEVDTQKQYTGRIIRDSKGLKKEILLLEGLQFGKSATVFTDNRDDLSLIQSCSKAFVVSNKKSVSFWYKSMVNHPDWEILYV